MDQSFMKKIFYLLMTTFAVLCVCSSCSKDDEGKGGSSYSELIIGTWKLDQRYDHQQEEFENEGVILCFKSDGNGYIEYTDEGPEHNSRTSVKWSINGSKLLLEAAADDESAVADIQKLDDKELVLVESYKEDGQEWKFTMYFSRVK